MTLGLQRLCGIVWSKETTYGEASRRSMKIVFHSRTFHPSGPDFQTNLGRNQNGFNGIRRQRKCELINGDGTVRDVFTLPAPTEWPEVVTWGVADARRTFVRDRNGNS
jgi:hypothetical protein